MEYKNKLDGFGIAGYRSFGDKMEFIKDLNKVNIFIGKNNSGKSNILRFCKHLSKIKKYEMYAELNEDVDYYKNSNYKEINYAYQIKNNSKVIGDLFNKILNILPDMTKNIPEWKENIWFKYSIQKVRSDRHNDKGLEEITNMIMNAYDHQTLALINKKHLNIQSDDTKTLAQEIAMNIRNFISFSFQVNVIGAFRQITNEDPSSNSDFNGKGLIRKLRKIQSPTIQKLKDKEKFGIINKFLCELIGEKDAYLEIPGEVDEIYVTIRNQTLHLDSLGTGVHELIILAAAVTIEENVIFCIEEPEIHLHPELQKKFVNYILKNTNNQYMISTHSNAFFDIQGVNIYHCKLIDGKTKCNLVSSDFERSGILSDLGYKPSDLLQSNYIIWVEGPSDRIYIKYWIYNKDSSLIEGLHYSIMFYGGKLLSHLAFDAPEVDEFIQLCKLNRNASIVIDSDKNSSNEHINRTKKRIKKDFENNSCYVWVTNGRTIENYLPESIFNESVNKVYPKNTKPIKWKRFGNMTKIYKNTSINKVAIAKIVTKNEPDYSILDLDKVIDGLIKCIKAANS